MIPMWIIIIGLVNGADLMHTIKHVDGVDDYEMCQSLGSLAVQTDPDEVRGAWCVQEEDFYTPSFGITDKNRAAVK